MPWTHALVSLLLFLVTSSVTFVVHATESDMALRADLEHISHQRIIFGHQSVGANLLDGVSQLARQTGIPINIVEVSTTDSIKTPSLGHLLLAKNGDPFQKLQSFERSFGNGPAGVDIAMVKFCYVDFANEVDVKELFASYQSTIGRLKMKSPNTVFLHVTVPLTTVQDGIKMNLKRLLGLIPYGIEENMRREFYNSLLRQTYSGHEPVFDLARIESTSPDGELATVSWNGNVIPIMESSYTDDGGHLNNAGKLRAARELVSVMAAIPYRPDARSLHR